MGRIDMNLVFTVIQPINFTTEGYMLELLTKQASGISTSEPVDNPSYRFEE
jgi:hypothetical protein